MTVGMSRTKNIFKRDQGGEGFLSPDLEWLKYEK